MIVEYIFKDACIVSTILFLWFNTDSLVEYLKLFKLDFLIKDFLENGENKPIHQYIFSKRLVVENRVCKFFIKLISCPVCLGMILSILLERDINAFPVYITTLIIYFTVLKLK